MSFTASTAVSIICTKANDPNQERYGDLAYDYLNESISELMDKKEYTTEDVYGLVAESSASVNKDGFSLNSIVRKIANIENIFCDPSLSTASSKIIKEVDVDFFNGLQGQHGFIDSDEVLAYRVGDNYNFFPASNASGIRVKIIYTKYADEFSSNEPTTDLLIYFSKNFVYKAIKLSTQKLLKERGTE